MKSGSGRKEETDLESVHVEISDGVETVQEADRVENSGSSGEAMPTECQLHVKKNGNTVQGAAHSGKHPQPEVLKSGWRRCGGGRGQAGHAGPKDGGAGPSS